MTIDYDSRNLDLELSEELGGETPPDLTDAIMEAIGERRTSAQRAAIRARGNSRFPQRIAVSWRAVAVGTAIVISAIAVGYSLMDADPRPPHPSQGPRVTHAGLFVPDASRATELRGRPVLQNGWLYADGSVPEILAGVQIVRFQDARAVVKLGSIPNVYEAARMKGLLQQSVSSKEELEMLFDRSKWTTGMGLALCLFAGEASISDKPVRADNGTIDITIADVFNRFDLDGSGKLESRECICHCLKSCDANQDGAVTRQEFEVGATKLAGSSRNVIEIVKRHGGLDEFYELAAADKLKMPTEPVTMKAVFAFLDKDGSGVLEKAECICDGSKNADLNQDGKVTPQEIQKIAVEHFGSIDKFLEVVAAHGGIAEFFAQVIGGDETDTDDGLTVDAVFRCYDQDGSGILEFKECVCHGTKNADYDKNGSVSRDEFTKIVRELFGTDESFLDHVRACGGAEEFYALVIGK